MVFKFTREYTKKFLFKAFWALMLGVMLITLLLGGIALMIGNSNTAIK